jgi:penicillin-binding protein 2
MFKFQSKGFKNKRIRFTSSEEIEPHEILLDSLAKKKEEELGISEKKIEVPLYRKILQGFFVFCFLVIFILFVRTFQIQVMEGKKFSALAEENKFIIRQIQAERGVIYDSNLTQLVSNKPSFDLVATVSELPKTESEKEKMIKEISQIIQKDYEEIKKEINDSKEQQVFVAENLDHQTLILLEAKINEFPGFEIQNNTTRDYVGGPVFSNVLGYKRKNEEKTGLESYYNEILKPKPGEIQIKRDAKQNPISKEIVSLPESGQSLVLWLDAGLQRKAAESLKNSILNTGAKAGAVVALDPKTGGVLALVSYPDFDNNLFSQGMSSEQWKAISNDPKNPLFNRAISGIGYPTGSTIKPLIASAALEEGIVKPETKLNCPLEICIQNPWFPDKEDCYADWKYHGTSDIRRAIAESVNTFFYQVGGGYKNFKGLGPTKIKNWLKTFNWGSKTGVDLPREGEGILPNLEDEWRIGDTYHLSIGQGPFSATPLQVAAAYVSIANKGKFYQPQIVKEIVDKEKKPIKTIEPKILKELPVKEENLQVVREGMRQGVSSPDGSSYVLSSLPVPVAAKTGTAQTGKKTSDNKDYLDSWVGVFAPYDDPRIVLVAVVEGVREGQVAALPIAKEVLEWYFSR